MALFNEAVSLFLRKEKKAPAVTPEEHVFDTQKVQISAQLEQIGPRRTQAIESGASQEKIRDMLRAINVDEAHLQDELEALERSQRTLQAD